MTGKLTYPAKIMLAGEYGVVVGGCALTIPFDRYRAFVRSARDIPPDKKMQAKRSMEYLCSLYDYIRAQPSASFQAIPDLGFFAENLRTWWLDVEIPVGFGLGSSGAVSAAVYDKFFPGIEDLSLQQRKEDLAVIESFFHGRSSGLDALTCHEASALRLSGSGSIERMEMDLSGLPGGYVFFLLNSGERFDTGPLVKHFLMLLQDRVYRETIMEGYLPLNQRLTGALLGETRDDPFRLVKEISEFQLRHFRKMIPDTSLDFWMQGLSSDEYYLKLNGSGGGYMLGITHRSFMETLQKRWGDRVQAVG